MSFPVLALLGTGFLGLARMARVVAQVVRLVRGGAQTVRTVGQARRVFTRSGLKWIAPVAFLVTLFAAVIAWRYETATTTGSIQSWHDAVWWSVMTLMSADNGNLSPRTPEGRIAGIVVILIGLTVVGWVTASLASLFVEGDEDEERKEEVERLDAIGARLASLEAKIDRVGEMKPREEEPDPVGLD